MMSGGIYPFSELHKKFGIVFQNDVLFADTVEENIRFGRDNHAGGYRESRCVRTGTAIHPKNWRTDSVTVWRSTRFQPERRPETARAASHGRLQAHPEILILDDSSSALDYQTDARLRQALSKNFRKTTTIIVAQRASSIRHADHILMLENGRRTGYGTHEELMAACDITVRSDSQMGGEKVD